MYPPMNFIFWEFVAAYVVHILEESVLGENFVHKLQTKFFPAYTWGKFFGFNTILLLANAIAIILFENYAGGWVVLPLGLAIERTLNGFWHLGETVITRKFSSGLLASTLTWILFYLLARYYLLVGEVSLGQFWIALAIGAIIETLMFATMFIVRAKTMPQLSKIDA